MEVRDYRRRLLLKNGVDSNHLNTNYTKANHDLHFILLQPSMQTLLADLNSITNDGNFIWTQEDKYALESQLLLVTSQPLCLNPSPMVSLVKNKILTHKFKMSDRYLKKATCRYSHAYTNRAARWHEYSLPYPYQILKIRKQFSGSGSGAQPNGVGTTYDFDCVHLDVRNQCLGSKVKLKRVHSTSPSRHVGEQRIFLCNKVNESNNLSQSNAADKHMHDATGCGPKFQVIILFNL